jgi:prophage regulatory protein
MLAAETQSCVDGANEMQLKPLPEIGYLRLPQVLSVYPVSKSTWWAGVKAGKYPQAVKLGRRITAWRAEDIRSLIERTGGAVSATGR